MKYIYKHGNQYWYQRAVPSKLSNLLGRKTLKNLIKNKIKFLQQLKEQNFKRWNIKKMFKIAENSLRQIF